MPKLTDKTELTTPASGDYLYIVDSSDTTDDPQGSSKKIKYGNISSIVERTTLVTVGTDSGCDYVIDGTDDDVQIQEAIDAVTNEKTIVVVSDVSLSSTIVINNSDVHIIHLGNITLAGGSGACAYQIGNTSMVKRVTLRLRNIDGTDKTDGQVGIKLYNCSACDIEFDTCQNVGKALYFTGARFDENILRFNQILYSEYAIHCDDTGALVGEGNQFLFGGIFACNHGVVVANGAKFGYMWLNGTIDNAGVAGSDDYVNNMATSQAGSLLLLKYLRPTSSTLFYKDVVMMSGNGRIVQAFGIESLKDITASLSTGRGGTVRHLYFKTAGSMSYNAVSGDTEIAAWSIAGTGRLALDSAGKLTWGADRKTFINVQPSASEPTSPVKGDIYLDDGTNTGGGGEKLRYYSGAAWVNL